MKHKKIPAISITFQHWDNAGNWNPFSWKTITHSSYIMNTMAADDLAPCITRSSAAMEVSQFSCNKPEFHNRK